MSFLCENLKTNRLLFFCHRFIPNVQHALDKTKNLAIARFFWFVWLVCLMVFRSAVLDFVVIRATMKLEPILPSAIICLSRRGEATVWIIPIWSRY